MNPLLSSLSVRTDFSIGESSLQIKVLIAQATALEIKAIAVTDTMSVSSMPVFFSAAVKAGIKPICGVVVRIVTDPAERVKDREQGGYRIKAYAKTQAGMQQIFKLLSLGLQADHFYYHSRVSLDEVLSTLLKEDCIVTSGDLHSLWHHPDAERIAVQLAAKFDLYVEMVALDTPLFDRLNARAIAWHKSSGCSIIATRPVFYATPEDADSTDVLRAISTNSDADSMFVSRPFNRDMVLQEPRAFLTHAQEAWNRAAAGPMPKHMILDIGKIVDACTYEFKKLPPCMPKMADNEFIALTQRMHAGWKSRFSKPIWGHMPAPEDMQVYKDRLAFELGVIKKMDFSGYFLLVEEIVNWAKSQGIRVGPGRGSAGGSLIAYLMGITDLDPVRFDLLFERFINPDRTDLPDADLDFMGTRRHEIIEYLTDKYGKDYVCGIVNFTTLGAASALRDTARVHKLMPYEYSCSKQMEKEHGVSLGLTESADAVPDIDKFRQERPVLWNHALRIEGANRALGRHAAGVVVASEPIINRGVVSLQSGQPVVQWDKSQVENFGLIKIDVLGLSTLDVIGAVLDYIKERHGKTIDPLSLPLDDEATLKAFGRGDTVSVFQFESAGMRSLLRSLAQGGQLTFDDLCAATALFRPGPLDAGLCDRYVQCKQGTATPYYEHPILEECLSDTFGVMVYQEQTMQVVKSLAGFTPGDADHVRKAIGKKDMEKMSAYKGQFVAGAMASGMGEMVAEKYWSDVEGFAAYSFNKSHSYAYTLISWVTMWLKVHYPVEFYAGALSVVDDEARQSSLIVDAQARKLQVLPPCIDRSSDKIEIEGEDKLYAPFQAVKGISVATAAAIAKLRDHYGKFTFAPEATIKKRRKIEGHFQIVDEVVPAHIVEMTPEAQAVVFARSKINATALTRLERVGAMHKHMGGRPAMHPDRLRDRLELMPGFTVELVKAERGLTSEHLAKIKITQLIEETRSCEGCSLKGKPHPVLRMGDTPKFMLVFDAPTWQDEREGKLLAGDNGEVIKAGLKGVGLKVSDGYYTALVKAVKPKEVKALTNEMINGCSGFLEREIAILKPPVIIAMGSNAIRYFSPGVKGTPSDLASKAIYRSDLDATIIFGLNPATLFFNPANITLIEAVFDKLNDCLT